MSPRVSLCSACHHFASRIFRAAAHPVQSERYHAQLQHLRLLLCGVVPVLLSACASEYRHHGYVPPDGDLRQLAVGRDTRESVTRLLGRPSTSGFVSDSGIYFVRSKVRHYGPNEPEVVDRRVVAISFDDAGLLNNVEHFGLERGRVVRLQQRVTTGAETRLSFIRQLMGNIGRLDASDLLKEPE